MERMVSILKRAGKLDSQLWTDVQISTRTASGHDTPEEVSVHVDVIGTVIYAGRMRADVKWTTIDAARYMGLDIESTKQPWIWAVGPVLQGQSNRKRSGDGADAGGFEQHSSYGKQPDDPDLPYKWRC
jgi:hypothetical protein